ncbi:MAG: LamG domain-containing protein [Cyanobacteria bacterium P01_A01_bin.123]
MGIPKPTPLELAKQGNPNAIAALINRSLASYGISVFSISISGDLLAIELQSQASPIDPKILKRIQSGAKKLQIESVERIKVSEFKAAAASQNGGMAAANQPKHEAPHYSKMNIARSSPASKQSNILTSMMSFVGSGGLVIILALVSILGILGFLNHWANSSNRQASTVKVVVPPDVETSKDVQASNNETDANHQGESTVQVALPSSVAVLTGVRTFDGETDYIEVPNQSDLNFGTGDFSISVWIKTSRQSGIDIIVDKRVETSGPIQGYVLANYQGNILLQLADMGRKDGWTNYISAPFVADDQWHHVAVTVNRDEANGIRWYLDGSAVGTPANPTGRSGSLDNSQPLVIGKRSDHPSSPGFFSGEMADIKLFNTSLTPQQIESLANDPSF